MLSEILHGIIKKSYSTAMLQYTRGVLWVGVLWVGGAVGWGAVGWGQMCAHIGLVLGLFVVAMARMEVPIARDPTVRFLRSLVHPKQLAR